MTAQTQNIITLGVLAALGLGAYWLYKKNQAKTNTTGTNTGVWTSQTPSGIYYS